MCASLVVLYLRRKYGSIIFKSTRKSESGVESKIKGDAWNAISDERRRDFPSRYPGDRERQRLGSSDVFSKQHFAQRLGTVSAWSYRKLFEKA